MTLSRIYIDTMTGTWGDSADLLILQVDEHDVDHLADASDSEIIAWAKAQRR